MVSSILVVLVSGYALNSVEPRLNGRTQLVMGGELTARCIIGQNTDRRNTVAEKTRAAETAFRKAATS